MRHWTFARAFLFFVLPLSADCVNEPEALRMEIHPAKVVFSIDEPINVEVVLTAKAGPLVMSRQDPELLFDGVVTRLDGPKQSWRKSYFFICGRPPLLAIAFEFFDLGDVLRRFKVLRAGRAMTHRVSLINPHQTNDALEFNLHSREWVDFCLKDTADHGGSNIHGWPPGRYRISLRLDNRSYFGPAPLG